jgi:glycosyltransferase involved in cell wall biosynthesis
MKIGIAGYVATDNLAGWLGPAAATLPKGFPGAPLFATLIAALLDRGHEVSVYTLSNDIPPATKAPIIARGGPLTVYYCPYRRRSFRPNGRYLGRSLDLFRVERAALRRAMETDAPDVVHAHWTYELAMAAIDSGLPYVVTCHDSPMKVLLHFRNPYRLGRYLMARSVLRRATHLTAVSPYLRDEVKPMASAPIEVVPNPISPAVLRMAPDRPRTIDPAAPRVAMVLNGWIDLKNPEGGLAAFALLRKSAPGAELHVFGVDYEPHGPAAQWARRRDLAAGVTFHGLLAQRDLLAALQTMHLLLHPSLEEAGSMIVTEAMALGLPVIGGEASGAMPWITGDGAAGIMTDVRQPDRLAAAVQALLAEPGRYARCAEGAVARVRGVFAADAVARQYEAAYRAAIRDHLPSAAAAQRSAG